MPAAGPPEVVVARPTRGDVTVWAEFTGNTQAFEYAEVRARVQGVLEEIHFSPSTQVEKDQLLFTIERDAYEAARDAAQAELASATAARDRATSDLSRMEQAIKTDAVSQQDLDAARANRDQSEAAVLAAEAALAKARLDLSYTSVVAPIAGQVGRNLVDAGNIVGISEPTLLTTINRMEPIYVYFEAPEHLVLDWLERRRRGEIRDAPGENAPLVHVRTAADHDFTHEGPIDYADNTVDAATGTIRIRAVIENHEGLLFPGLFVRVRVQIGSVEDAILVDERAIGTDLGGKYVFVVGENDIVEQRIVELGVTQDDGTVPVLEGLEPDETYIVEGVLRARPGLPVTPKASPVDADVDADVDASIGTEDE